MSLQKLTAGDGYLYLIRQVAALDATERGRGSLGAYYAAKGESPGVWAGRGLVGLGIEAGSQVTEQQMLNLFGHGRHPNAAQIEKDVYRDPAVCGDRSRAAARASTLGRPFYVYEGTTEWRARLKEAYEAFNTVRGHPHDWPVPAEERERIRSDVARTMFLAQHDREPASEAEFSSFLARISRPRTTAVAGYDLTFSPVKSVSAAWALADPETAAIIRRCHDAAVAETLEWLQDEVVHTRVGANGVAQVKTQGLIVALFTHRDARSGEPDLHTHAAVSNKVQAFDGRWLALDGRALYRYKVAASELYNNKIEEKLGEALGWVFAAVERGDAKRQIRELVQVPASLRSRWSSRRHAIEERTAVLAREFATAHGRVPTTVETLRLAQQATLATRGPKHEPRSEHEQRVVWRAEALAVLGPRGLARVVRAGRSVRAYDDPNPGLTQAAAAAVLSTVEEQRATWGHNHVLAEARRQLRSGIRLPALATAASGAKEQPEDRVAEFDPRRHEQLAEQISAAVLAASIPLTNPADRLARHTPAVLRRDPDHSEAGSVYQHVGTQRYTSAALLEAEQRIVAAAGLRDGWRVDELDVDLALLQFAQADPRHPRTLNQGQEQLVRAMATSGARLQLAIAPAGTGKTTSMAVLAAAVRNAGGQLLGLAPQAGQAEVLAEAIEARADTLDKLVHEIGRRRPAQLADRGRVWLDVPFDETADAKRNGARWDEVAHAWYAPAGREQALARWADWVTAIGPGTVVVIDEAGRATTPKLDAAVGYIAGRGGVVRLIGDEAQFAATGAGGVLRDIDAAHGSLTLSEVVRFEDPVEAHASLALRAGDVTAIGFYLDHDRIRVATADAALDEVYRMWRDAVSAGADAVMHATRLDDVAVLNARARADRLTAAAANGQKTGRELPLAGGRETVSAGDLILTKENDRRLGLGGTDHVRNGHRWIIETVHRDGRLTVLKHGPGPLAGRRITLPADYVQKSVRLGYAATRPSVQGTTAGRRGDIPGISITLLDPQTEDRNSLYTTMTRGTRANYAVLRMPATGIEDDQILDRAAAVPEPVAELLAGILTRDGSAMSATTAQRRAVDPYLELGAAADAYLHSLQTAALNLIPAEQVDALISAAEQAVPGITDEATSPAWPTLLAHLILLQLDGQDPIQLLAAAAARRELRSARDLAAVLDWRLDETGNHSQNPGPLPWLPQTPDILARHPEWGPHLANLDTVVRDYATQLRAQAAHWTPATAPAWAQPYLTASRLPGQLAVWRAAHHVPLDDLAPAGPKPAAIARGRLHDQLVRQVIKHIGNGRDGDERWAGVLASLGVQLGRADSDTGIDTDPTWPLLAARLNLADSLGIDVPRLLAAAVAPDHPAGPLPAEHPSSALWWRLSAHLADPLAAQPGGNTHVRPPWTEQLPAALGDAPAARITSDRLWPVIVARLDTATRAGHSPAAILRAAADMLAAQTGQLRPDQLATALLWHISLITDPEPFPAEAVPHPDPASADQEPPVDADDLTHTADPAAEPVVVAELAAAGPVDEPPFDPDYDHEPVPDSTESLDPVLGVVALDQGFADQWLTALAAAAERSIENEPYRDLPAAERVAALTLDLENARTHLDQLTRAVLTGNGPHRAAAYDSYIRPYAERAETLYPLLADRDWAKQVSDNWAARAVTAETHQAQLADQLAQLADDDPRRDALTSQFDITADYATRWRAEADQHQHTLTAAQAALDQAADGQPVITRADVDRRLAAAASLDDDALAAARRDVDHLTAALWRATRARDRGDQALLARPGDRPSAATRLDTSGATTLSEAEPAAAVGLLERPETDLPAPSGEAGDRWTEAFAAAGWDPAQLHTDPAWPALTDALARAELAGADVNQWLTEQTLRRPPDDHPLGDLASLRLHLIDDMPAAAATLDPANAEAAAYAADHEAAELAATRRAQPEPAPTDDYTRSEQPEPSIPPDTAPEPQQPAPATPSRRWATLLEQRAPAAVSEPGWPELADALDRAAAAGWDPDQHLAELVDEEPLPRHDISGELRYRLIEACPAAALQAPADVEQRYAREISERTTPTPPDQPRPDPGRSGPTIRR